MPCKNMLKKWNRRSEAGKDTTNVSGSLSWKYGKCNLKGAPAGAPIDGQESNLHVSLEGLDFKIFQVCLFYYFIIMIFSFYY